MATEPEPQLCGFLGCLNPVTIEDPEPWSMCNTCYFDACEICDSERFDD